MSGPRALSGPRAMSGPLGETRFLVIEFPRLVVCGYLFDYKPTTSEVVERQTKLLMCHLIYYLYQPLQKIACRSCFSLWFHFCCYNGYIAGNF